MTSTTTRRRRAGVALTAATALTVGACAGGDGAASSESEQTLTVASPMSISSIDPHGPGSGDRPTITVSQHIFDSLVRREGSDFVPSLATSWATPDELTWEFQLVTDATFHDGSPVTAADVVASLNRLIELGGPLAAQWATLDEVRADGDHKVVITTTEPVGTMLSNLALLYIAPAEQLEAADFDTAPIGSGPFVLDSFEPGSQLTLSANDDYWGEKPEVSELVIRDIPEVSSLITSLETGEIDLTWGVPPDQFSQLTANSELTAETVPSFVYYMNWFNSAREPFTDPQVRRAMWHAIDVESVVSDLFPDAADVATAPIPSTVFGHAEQEPYEYDPELARELLAQAGYPDGFSTSLDLNAEGGGPQIRQIAQAFASYWQDIGVDVALEEKERAVWLEDLLALEWDMNLLVNAVLTGDADFTLGRLYPSDAGRTGYANEELDQILSQARQSLDQDEREELYAQANEIIWEDAVGIFPMQISATYAWRDNVSGFEPDPNETPLFTSVTVE